MFSNFGYRGFGGSKKAEKARKDTFFRAFWKTFWKKSALGELGSATGSLEAVLVFIEFIFHLIIVLFFANLVQLALPVVFWIRHFIFSDVSRIAWRSFNIRLITDCFCFFPPN